MQQMQQWIRVTKYLSRIVELHSWKKYLDEKGVENIILELNNKYALWRVAKIDDLKGIKQYLPKKGVIIEE